MSHHRSLMFFNWLHKQPRQVHCIYNVLISTCCLHMNLIKLGILVYLIKFLSILNLVDIVLSEIARGQFLETNMQSYWFSVKPSRDTSISQVSIHDRCPFRLRFLNMENIHLGNERVISVSSHPSQKYTYQYLKSTCP